MHRYQKRDNVLVQLTSVEQISIRRTKTHTYTNTDLLQVFSLKTDEKMLLYHLVAILLSIWSCLGSHFRGGIFTWTPTDNESQIEISYRVSWRRSSNSHLCNNSDIVSGQLMTGEGSLECFQGCTGAMTFLSYHCTDFSESEDWTTGTKTFLYNLPTSSQEIVFGFSSCCWIDTLRMGGGASWKLQAKAKVVKRVDTGRINSSPITSISPIVRIQYGCTGITTINLLVSDPDNDVVRCRWSTGQDECGGICSSFPGAIMNEENCTISYQANNNIGYYGVTVQVEDFPSTGGTVPYSSVPLQFLVEVYSTNQSCYSLPEFIAPTKADRENVYVTAGTTYVDKIVAISNVPNKRIVEITTVSPSGFVKSALAMYTNVQGAWYVTITWTPSTSDAGKTHILCFKAMDEFGLTSQQRCINLIVPPVSARTTTPWYHTTSSNSLDSAITSSCTSSGWYIQVDMYRLRQMYPNARESDIYLGENSCTGYSNGYTLVFQHGIRDCLTSETVTQNALVYRNRLFYAMRDPQYQFIIRGYNWTVEVECDVMRNETASSHISHNTIGSLDPGHVQGTSHYNITMRFYSDPNFQYEIPGNPLYVKVGADVYVKAYTDAADWGIKMIVRSCYTKPDQYASDSLKYYIIRDGCEEDVNTHYISQSTHETKFMFRDFEYTSNHEGLYLYCDATFCETSNYSNECQQSCNPRGKRGAESRPKLMETFHEKIIHTHI